MLLLTALLMILFAIIVEFNVSFLFEMTIILPHLKMRELQEQIPERENYWGLRQVDTFAGLNIMILLLELHRYGQNQEEQTKDKLTFYPCGKPNTEGKLEDPTLLLRLINSSDCLGHGGFRNTVGRFLQETNLAGASLVGANLVGVDLVGADLRGSNLALGDLEGANLSGANLIDAHLFGTLLIEADLFAANLENANLENATLGDDNFEDSSLVGVELFSVNLGDANLSGANLIGTNLSGANLSGADLSGADLEDTNLYHTKFSNNEGISASQKEEFIQRGAIFSDS